MDLQTEYTPYELTWCNSESELNHIVEYFRMRTRIGEKPLVLLDNLDSHLSKWNMLAQLMQASVTYHYRILVTSRENDWYNYGGDISNLHSIKVIKPVLEKDEAKAIYLALQKAGKLHPGISDWRESCYDGEAWMTPNHPEYYPGYTHCRFYSDYLYYLGKAIRLEKEKYHSAHPSWDAEFAKGLEILTDLWEREKDFGMYWNLESETVTLDRPGTCAGAFAILALAEGCRQYPENTRLADCFREACDAYYKKFVLTGRSFAGPVDILEADDSESIAALADALVQRYQLFGNEADLEQALAAAKIFATWCVNYQPSFPGGSTLEGINVCGGVVANVQNRHIGPGICTNSARFVYDLGRITGDNRWTELYYRIKAAAINCVCTYDGEFCGNSFREIFAQGMLSEQINMTDALNAAGETWRVSASWPATAVLLGWLDTP